MKTFGNTATPFRHGSKYKVDRLNWDLEWHSADPNLEDSTGVPGGTWVQGQPGGSSDQPG